MSIGPTKNITLGDAYQKVATLYDADQTDKIFIGDGAANNVLISFITYAGEIAWGETQPMISGHPIAAGYSTSMRGLGQVKGAWVRNNAAGSNSVMVITPMQIHEES